jgi:hypothetical protein
MTTIITYEERPLTAGRKISVLRNSRVIGMIQGNSLSGVYRYYHGKGNELNPEMEHRDLALLKRRIETEHDKI